MVFQSTAAEDDTPQCQSGDEITEAVTLVKEPITVPNITINLPHFNQISPGLLPLFGKDILVICMTRHA